MEEEKEIALKRCGAASGESSVKLSLQPMHDDIPGEKVSFFQEDSPETEELPISEEQKAKEAAALAKVLLMQEESEREGRFSGLILPWKLSIMVLLIILFFVILHFAFSLFAPRGVFLKGLGESPDRKTEQIGK